MLDPVAQIDERGLLHRQRLAEIRCGPGQQNGDPGQAEAEALQGEDLGQPGDFRAAIETPVLFRPARRDQATILVDAQRPDRQAETLRAFGSGQKMVVVLLVAHESLLNSSSKV
ncbi:hypothetical protein D3C72_1807690 [compost metagenome]